MGRRIAAARRTLALYSRLIFLWWKFSILKELEYRVNFLTNAFMSVFWLVWGVLGATIFFAHRDEIGGWSFYQVLVVLGMFSIFTGVMEAFFRPNIMAMIEQVRDGKFDFVLVKPVNAQFYASFHSLTMWRLVDIFAGGALIVYALIQMQVTPTPFDLLAFFVLLVIALTLVYCFWLAMMTMAFWFVKVDNLAELFYSFYETARFPITVYGTWLRALLTFVIPIAFITTFPSAALIGQLEPVDIVIGLGLAALLLFGSNRLWNFAIRSYASASS
ncbi:MAG: ABC-2 family transporter protein [Anaerolineae bacterium]|nr:ABC-2 family transporter protein [Anaerolineae bacterium]